MPEEDSVPASSALSSSEADHGVPKKRRRKNQLPGWTPECEAAMASAKDAMNACLDFHQSTGKSLADAQKVQKEAKAAAKEAANQIKLHQRKVRRLQKKAQSLSDEGLLLEYSRRQASKASKPGPDAIENGEKTE